MTVATDTAVLHKHTMGVVTETQLDARDMPAINELLCSGYGIDALYAATRIGMWLRTVSLPRATA